MNYIQSKVNLNDTGQDTLRWQCGNGPLLRRPHTCSVSHTCPYCNTDQRNTCPLSAGFSSSASWIKYSARSTWITWDTAGFSSSASRIKYSARSTWITWDTTHSANSVRDGRWGKSDCATCFLWVSPILRLTQVCLPRGALGTKPFECPPSCAWHRCVCPQVRWGPSPSPPFMLSPLLFLSNVHTLSLSYTLKCAHAHLHTNTHTDVIKPMHKSSCTQ